MGRKDSLPEDAPAPRLCDLVKWAHFQGYGFNLHSEKGREGQFVGKIDAGSPAEACGLLEGDQIIEVNGVNTSNENHKQVVERIKTDPARVSLLVVDPKTAEYYRKRSVVVKGSLPTVRHVKAAQPAGHDQETGESETSSQTQLSIEDSLTLAAQGGTSDEPPPVPPKTDLTSLETEESTGETLASAETNTVQQPQAATGESQKTSAEQPAEEKVAEEETAESEKSAEEKPAEEKLAEEKSEPEKATAPEPEEKAAPESEEKPAPASPKGGKSATIEKSAEKEANGSKDASPRVDTSLQVESGSDRTQPSPAPSAGSTGTVESAKSAESGPPAADGDKFGLKLNMTAAEMKEYLKTKKRHDPRNDTNLSFKRRHEIVQNM